MGQSPRKKRPEPGNKARGKITGRPDAERRLRQADRFARILKLLELLQERSAYDAKALAVALETTERTVYRDLQVLALAGIPCDYDREKGRYVLRGDYRFAVTSLTDDELLGQATAAALTSARGLDVGAGAEPTVRKLWATSRERARTLLEDAQRVTAVLDLKLADHETHRETIRVIQWALIDRKCLEGSYASPYQSAEKRLVLHPYRLCLVKQAWYLIARPEGSTHPVTYRVARFRSLRALDAAADVPEDFDLRAYFGDAWAVYRGDRSLRGRGSVRARGGGAGDGDNLAPHPAGAAARGRVGHAVVPGRRAGGDRPLAAGLGRLGRGREAGGTAGDARRLPPQGSGPQSRGRRRNLGEMSSGTAESSEKPPGTGTQNRPSADALPRSWDTIDPQRVAVADAVLGAGFLTSRDPNRVSTVGVPAFTRSTGETVPVLQTASPGVKLGQ